MMSNVKSIAPPIGGQEQEGPLATDMKPGSRTGAAKMVKYFGKFPGQSVGQFAQELKQLTDDDHRQLLQGIENGTLDY